LNDEKITEFVKDKFNIQIVRRTISKYREEIGIPTSRQRKRDYKLRGEN
jgi:RNA polymerase sigma-54 factor